MTTRLVALLVLAPSLAAAHPGHGHTEPQTWAHYLTEPVHVAAIAAALSLAIAVGAAWRRARIRRPS